MAGWTIFGIGLAGLIPQIFTPDEAVHDALVAVLADLDLTIPAHRFTAIVGPNGSGKSTLMKAMLQILDKHNVHGTGPTGAPAGYPVTLDGKAPADWRATFKDKTAARACLKQMLDWQPEKIILAHGRCYETGGTDELRRAFRWLD